MPANPLTDPNWAADLADTVERVVGTVREKATTPVVHVTRGDRLRAARRVPRDHRPRAAADRAAPGPCRRCSTSAVEPAQAVYLSYLIIGGILCLAGLLVLRKRQLPDA